MRVLIIEHDSATARSIELVLKSKSWLVYTTDLGQEGLELAKLYNYDIVLLELSLPDMSGHAVIKKLRDCQIKTPILILSDLTDSADKAKVWSAGADDYMTKPIDVVELVARIEAIVRRAKGHAQSIIKTGDLSVDLSTKRVTVKGVRVDLTDKEYRIIELLSLRKGEIVTKEMCIDHVYGGFNEPEIKIIDVFICRIRKKLSGPNKVPHHIETVWGRGYALRDPTE